MLKVIQSKRFQILLIVILTILVYSNIFQNDFATDDIAHVFNWKTNKEIKNIPKIFFEESVPPDETGAYRPIRALFLMGVYKLFEYNVLGYHAFSLTIYILSIILIYLITLEITKKKAIAFLATLLFSLHPIHTEAVAYIIASFDSAGFMFYLLSFWLYIRFRHSGKPRQLTGRIQNLSERKVAAVRDSGVAFDKLRLPRMTLLLSLFSALLAVLTYELAFSLPLAILLYEFCIGSLSSRGVPTHSGRRGDPITRKGLLLRLRLIAMTKRLGLYLPYFALFLSVAIFRFFILHILMRGDYLAGSFYTSILASIKALAYYIYLFTFPVNLSINHEIFEGVFAVIAKDYINTETLKTLSIFNLDILLSLILLIGLVVTAIFMFQRVRLVSFAIFWFFITLLPVSFLLPQISILSERYAFLASYGYCLVVGYILTKALSLKKLRVIKFITIIMIIILLFFYGTRTYLRNQDWKDTLTVWQVLAKQGPKYPLNNLTLARIYEDQKKYDQSLSYYKKLTQINFLKSEVYYKIGLIYHRQGRLEDAKKNYEISKKLNSSYSNLSEIQLEKIERFGLDTAPASPLPLGEGGGEGGLVEYSIDNQVSFTYPTDWLTEESEHGVNLNSALDPFFVEISIVSKDDVSQEESYGKLINQGPAFIPSMDKADVRVFEDKGIQKMLFFLYKNDLVIRVLVYPSDSALMREFDKTLGSIKISNIK